MDSLLKDVRYALRGLAGAPGFSAVVVATLALGIGANSAIFSVVDGILFRSLSFPEPDRLVMVWHDYSRRGGPEREWLSYPNFEDVRAGTGAFEALAVFQGWSPTLTGAGDPEMLTGTEVSADMLTRVLRLEPVVGRSFVTAEDEPGAEGVVVISHGLWTRTFGADHDVVGRSVTLSGEPHVIVGVLPAGFAFPFQTGSEIFRPLRLTSETACGRGCVHLRGIGRLAPGVSLERARSLASTVGARLERTYPEDNAGVGFALHPLHDEIVAPGRTGLLALLGAVGLVLLIACTNVANLLLARSSSRAPELALRSALGAGRGRIARQLLTESALLAAAGGIAAVVIAAWATDALVALAPAGTPRIHEVAVNGRVLSFTAVVALAAGLLFGIVPALEGSRTELADALAEAGRGGAPGPRARRVRSAFVVAQVSLALVLLTGAGLLLESLRNLGAVDLGFDPDGVLALQLSLPATRYEAGPARADFYSRLVDRLERVPGVEAAAAVSTLPLTGNDGDANFVVEGLPPFRPGEEPAAWVRPMTPAYLETLGIPVVRGRSFGAGDDATAPRVVIVNRTFAERFFPDEDPIGRRISFGDYENPTWREIVGVAGDVKNFGMTQPSRLAVYLPHAQVPFGAMALAVRTSGDPERLAAPVRAALAELDPELAASGVVPLRRIVRGSLALERFTTVLLGLFAGLALVLAAVGIYGVVSHLVGRRGREMGIRMALGAEARQVRRMVLGNGLLLVSLGVGVGVLAALATTRLMRALLFGVDASDPGALAAGSAVLVAAALIASYVPARRAARLDPVAVLRRE